MSPSLYITTTQASVYQMSETNMEAQEIKECCGKVYVTTCAHFLFMYLLSLVQVQP